MSNLLKNNLDRMNIKVTENQIKQFDQYYEMLVEWNKVMNLTAITEYDEVIVKHFSDSLSIVKMQDMQQDMKIIDIGTGAGFPGIPLKIVFPDLQMTLLDSLNKRVKFLNAVIENLGLNNIETLHGRAEDFARRKEYRETYDMCVSRAVANLSTLSEYCIPYIRVGGIFISYKSGEIEQEADKSKKSVKILGGDIIKVEKFNLTDTEIGRSFVKIEKNKETPKEYPRKAGIPAKDPL